MKWSWKIFTAFGIGVYVHATFLLLLLLVFLDALLRKEGSFRQGIESVIIILALFLCVLLHEFGHALVAKRFGVATRDITLLPIGGLARLERIPSEPRQELLIAAAGPAVNLALAGLLFFPALIIGWGPLTHVLPGKMALESHGFLWWLISINLGLAIFNFIPAFPMDGGRILRALLALKLDYLQATRIAVAVGQALAFAAGFFGLLNGEFMLILIAIFVYLGAAHEGALVQYRQSFQGLPSSCAMVTNFNSLQETDTLEKAVEFLLLGTQVDFPVLRGREIVGVLPRGTLIDSLGKLGPKAILQSVPIQPAVILEDDVPLDLALEKLQEAAVKCLPVMRRGDLVGIITMENLAEFAMVQKAMQRRAASAAPPGP